MRKEALILEMIKQGHEREVAVYCLQEVKFRSAQEADSFLKREDPLSG